MTKISNALIALYAILSAFPLCRLKSILIRIIPIEMFNRRRIAFRFYRPILSLAFLLVGLVSISHSAYGHTSSSFLVGSGSNASVEPDYIKVDSYASSVNNVDVVVPSGYGTGDIMIVHIVTDDDGVITEPAGFTQLYDIFHDGNGPLSGLFYRLLDGTEPSSYNFAFPSEPAVASVIIYKNINTANPFDGMASLTGDSNIPMAPAITTTSPNRTVLQFIGIDGASAGVLTSTSTTSCVIAGQQSGNSQGAEMIIVSEHQSIPGTTPIGTFSFPKDEWTGFTIALNLYSINVSSSTGVSCASSTSTVTVDHELPSSSGLLEIVDPSGTVISTQSYASAVGSTTLSFNPTSSGDYLIRDQSAPSISTLSTFYIDSDGDSYCDDVDADDDNDGILDVVESPSCFNTITGYESGDRQAIISVSSDFDITDGAVQELVDGITSTTGNGIRKTNGNYSFTTNPGNLWQIQLNEPIKYTSFTLYTEGSVYLDTDLYGTIQGSNNGSSWIDLTVNNTLLMDDPNTIYTIGLTQNTSSFLYYRMNCTGGQVDDDEWLSEVVGTTEFVGAAPNVSGCSVQGVMPAYLNTDTDGDGCPDALEGSATIAITSVNNGRLLGGVDGNGVPLIVNGGQGIGGSLNESYFDLDCPCSDPNKLANNCDFDNDSYKNEIDEDDDNDGILDSEECGDFNFVAQPGGSVNNVVTVCYNEGTLGINASTMTFADDKLLNPSNFGPSGIYPMTFEVKEVVPANITTANLIAQGCHIFHVGGSSGLSGTEEIALTAGQKQELYNWSILSPSNVVFAFQGMVTAYTDHIGTNGTNNPTSATNTGRGIFEGPFGTVAAFNQAGSYQGTFTPGSDPICSIMQDQNGGIVGLVDVGSQDIFIADFGLFSEASGLTSNINITSSTDRMFANIYAFMAQFILEDQQDMCYYLEECLDDLDLDNFPNVVDNDADGDGCDDALEGATGFSDTQVVDGQLTGGVGSTGIPTLAGPSGQMIGQALDAMLKDACSFDLKLDVSPTSVSANKGEQIEYIYTLTNESTNSVDDVEVRILTPSNTEFLAAIPDQGSYSNLSKIWDVGTVVPGSVTIKVVVAIK